MSEVENKAVMTDAEKEKAYCEAVGYLTSSLTNDELLEESLQTLLALSDYKDSAELYEKYKAKYERLKEEKTALLKKRKSSRLIQGILVALGGILVLSLIILLVYLLKLDIVR